MDVQIKWPNDIFAENKKLCGILVESYNIQNIRKYIVGIGINVFKETSTTEPIIGFLEDYTTHDLQRETLLNEVMNQIKEDIKIFKRDGFESFRDYFLGNCQNLGKKITVKVGDSNKKGVFDGITLQGHLILNEKDIIVKIPAGEILQKD